MSGQGAIGLQRGCELNLVHTTVQGLGCWTKLLQRLSVRRVKTRSKTLFNSIYVEESILDVSWEHKLIIKHNNNVLPSADSIGTIKVHCDIVRQGRLPSISTAWCMDDRRLPALPVLPSLLDKPRIDCRR